MELQIQKVNINVHFSAEFIPKPPGANVGKVRDNRSTMLFTIGNARLYTYFGTQFLTKL